MKKEIKSQVTLIGPCKLENKFKLHSGLYIFVDGGQKHRIRHFKKIKNYISVGDQDSTTLSPDIRLDSKKNYSDLAYALSLVPKNTETLYFDGFFPDLKSEKRFDHLLCNIGEIYHFASFHKIKAHLNSKMILFSLKKFKFSVRGSFSIFSIEKSLIKLTGHALYKINQPRFIRALSSETLSNVGSGLIQIESTKPLLLIKNK